MKRIMIKGSLVSLVLGTSILLSGSILFLDKDNTVVIISIIAAILLVYIYLLSWCRTILIEEDSIVLKRLRSSVEITKAEISEIRIKLISTVILTKDGSKHRILASGFKRAEMALLNNRLRDFQKGQ